MKPILKSYLIEVNLGTTVPGQGTNIPFQDYPQLRDIYITGITTSDSNTVTFSPAGKQVVTTLSGISVTFIDKFNMEILRGYSVKELKENLEELNVKSNDDLKAEHTIANWSRFKHLYS